MNFIEVNELYYHSGGYLSKPLMCNVNEISSVTLNNDNSGYTDMTYITMSNGTRYGVRETYKEVINKIRDATREDDDLK